MRRGVLLLIPALAIFLFFPFNYELVNHINPTQMVKVVQIPVLSDNYAYLLIDTDAKIAAAVDPVEPNKVIEAAKAENVEIVAILTTHHHWDHADGNPDLNEKCGGNLLVYGGDDRIPALNTKLTKENSEFNIGSIPVKVLFTPCHTTGHVLYYINYQDQKYLFSGDTLFLAGCGKFFEGTADQMADALIHQVRALPKDTQVMCGHEYSVSNLQFAKSVDPDNEVLKNKLAWAIEQRKANKSTVPSTLEEELAYNPFMRVDQDIIKNAVGKPDGGIIEVMGELRARKNGFVAPSL